MFLAGGGVTVGPRALRSIRRRSLGPSIPVPPVHLAVRSLSFVSAARHRSVGVRIVVPPELPTGKPVPVCLWLHGRGGSAASVTSELRIPNFLAAAVADGVPPFAVVSVDGGTAYWHKRASGDDPEHMIMSELPGVLDREGIVADRWAIAGWSMGGYGALLLAERHDRFVAAVASSPAVWRHGRDTAPGAFDSSTDFKANDVLAELSRLPKFVRIDCGTDDPFASTTKEMLRRVDGVEGTVSEGAHTMRFWRAMVPGQLRFLSAAFAAS